MTHKLPLFMLLLCLAGCSGQVGDYGAPTPKGCPPIMPIVPPLRMAMEPTFIPCKSCTFGALEVIWPELASGTSGTVLTLDGESTFVPYPGNKVRVAVTSIETDAPYSLEAQSSDGSATELYGAAVSFYAMYETSITLEAVP